MRIKVTLRLLAAEITAIAINVVPLALWLYEDYSAEATMLIYGLECAAAIAFAALFVLIASPPYDPEGTAKYKRKGKLISDFLVVSVGLLAATTVFMSAFLFLVLRAQIQLSVLVWAFMIVLAFQFAEFIIDIFTLRPLPLRKAEHYLTRSMGRSALLFMGIFLGIFLAGIVNEWFVVPFIVLKTIVDIGEPIQFLFGKEKNTRELEFNAELQK